MIVLTNGSTPMCVSMVKKGGQRHITISIYTFSTLIQSYELFIARFHYW